MDILVSISGCIIPALIFFIAIYGALKKVPVYDEFVEGAKDGIKTVYNIAPTLVGLMVAVGILRSSGLLDFLSDIIGNFTDNIGFPSQLVPLALVRMFSSSAATGLVLDIFEQFGTDTFIGITASIIMSCTETIFYTMSVYFLTAKVTKTRWTLPGALIATTAGIISSVILAMLIAPIS